MDSIVRPAYELVDIDFMAGEHDFRAYLVYIVLYKENVVGSLAYESFS